MPINIANVELSNSFDNWRTTTNDIIKALKEEVVLTEQLDLNSLSPFPELVGAAVVDSIETVATRINETDNTVTIADASKIGNFKAGQKVRLYGARLAGSSADILLPPTLTSAIAVGFEPPSPSTVNLYTEFGYRIAQFDYTTGKVSGSTAPLLEVRTSEVRVDMFSDVKNVGISFTRSNENYGVLIYRRATGAGLNRNYALVAVLGPKDLSGLNCTWVDYYDYNYVAWGKKNVYNEFTSQSELVHFPISPSVDAKLGWIDAEIDFVDPTLKRIRFINDYVFEPSIVVSHNDTQVIQDAINERDNLGAKSLSLSTKTYIVEGLVIPNDFALLGNGSKTRLKKLSWSGTTSATGNRILKNDFNLSGGIVNDFTLSDIVLDGNMQNQILLSETNDDKSNYLVDVRGNTLRYENIKLSSSVGGGINASGSVSVSVISSFLVDSNLSDLYGYSPLDITGSSDVIVSSNIFKNFSGSVEASIVNGGTIVGNIVKNCGSGLVIYGATNLVSSPNILQGPAGEFLPSPDILNSEYDSINIKPELNSEFTSPMFVYQESGETVNLTLNRSTLVHRLNKLEKIDSIESLYDDEILINGFRPAQPVSGPNSANGQFRFRISAQNVNVLLNSYSYSDLKGSGAGQNPNHFGLVYRSMLTEYVPSRDVDLDTVIQSGYPVVNNVSKSVSANTSGVNVVAKTIKVNNIGSNVSLNLNAGDRIYYNLPATNTAIGGLTANTIYYVTFANNTDVALSTTYNGANISLTETRVANPAETHSIRKVAYFVKLQAGANGISIGDRVRFLSHNGATPSLNDEIQVGTVIDFNSSTLVCSIAYSPDINITTVGAGGTLTVENTKVLAKGRIL